MAKFDGKKILIVEDDNLLSEMLAKKFIEDKALIARAVDGVEAVSMINMNRYDLILLDLLLPKLNGFDFLEALNISEISQGTSVIVLSNLSQKNDIDRAVKLGARMFLVKAILSLDEIVEASEKVLK